MKNTKNKLEISKKNIIKKNSIIPGIIVFGMFSLVSCSNQKDELINNTITNTVVSSSTDNKEKVFKTSDNEYYNYYSSSYVDSLKKHRNDEYDEKFGELYNKEKIFINNKEYNSRDVYIMKCNDNSVHLYIAGTNVDILNGKEFNKDNGLSYCFNQTSMFYQLYLDGKIIDDKINVNENDLLTWNGERHTATRDMEAEKEASEAFQKKYGR